MATKEKWAVKEKLRAPEAADFLASLSVNAQARAKVAPMLKFVNPVYVVFYPVEVA